MIGLYVSLLNGVSESSSMSNGVMFVMVGCCRCGGAGNGRLVFRALPVTIWLT